MRDADGEIRLGALRGIERQQLAFVRYGRPGAAVASLIVFGIYYLVAPSTALARLLALLVVALLVSGVDILALRRFAVGVVARVTLAIDIGLIAAMLAVLDNPALLVVPYFAPVAFGALLFGPRETALYAVLGAVAAIGVGAIIDAGTLTIVAGVLVLLVTGAILAGLSAEVRQAQTELTRDRELDMTALGIAERIRSSLALHEILPATVEELGSALNASRCRLRVVDGPVYEWTREGVAPVRLTEPPPPVRSVFETEQPLVVNDAAEADEETRALLEAIGSTGMLAYPIAWQDRVIGTLGLTIDHARDWSADAVPLLERIAPQLGAALAQADAFERKQAALEGLQRLTTLRENLVANVSHELRTPLTSTLGSLQTLERRGGELDEATRRRLVVTAREEAERLARLVDDLLDFERLQRGKLQLDVAPVPVEAAVRRAVGMIAAEEARVDVDVSPDVVANADERRLLQVLCNLLSNAAEHGAGRIRVTGERTDTAVWVAVSDDGEGVPREHLSELFLPFTRWSTHRDSTGLGLAIARGIAQAHGGSLVYRPGEDGNRHGFVLTLPAA